MHPCLYIRIYIYILNTYCFKLCLQNTWCLFCLFFPEKKTVQRTHLQHKLPTKFQLRCGCCDNCSGTLGCCGDFSSDAPWHISSGSENGIFREISVAMKSPTQKQMTKSSFCLFSQGIIGEKLPIRFFFASCFTYRLCRSSKRPWFPAANSQHAWGVGAMCRAYWVWMKFMYLGVFWAAGCKVDQ